MAILNDGDILHAEAFNNKADKADLDNKQDKITADSSFTLKNLTISNELETNKLIVNKIIPSTAQQINLSRAELKAIKNIELNDGTNNVIIFPSADGITFSKALKVNAPNEDNDAVNKLYVDTETEKKQNNLISGTTIKTINGETLLGSGDITISITHVDDVLSATSTNPVQNKIINTALANKTDLSNSGASSLINKLNIGADAPSDADYFISQYAGGGTTNTNYYRRPVSALNTYIKSKADKTPTSGSTNLITSGAVYTALELTKKDFIIDEGTIATTPKPNIIGIDDSYPKRTISWTWRKWNSGLFECWGIINNFASKYIQINSGYRCQNNIIQLPQDLSTKAIDFQYLNINLSGNTVPAWGGHIYPASKIPNSSNDYKNYLIFDVFTFILPTNSTDLTTAYIEVKYNEARA